MYPSGVKRHLGYRIIAGMWGVWFAAALIGPATLHACPEHAARAHAAHDAVNHHDGHAAAAEQNGSAPTPTTDADCNCLGDCSSASAVQAPKQQIGRVDSFVLQSRVATIQDAGEPGLIRDHDRPFANGPPSAFSATA